MITHAHRTLLTALAVILVFILLAAGAFYFLKIPVPLFPLESGTTSLPEDSVRATMVPESLTSAQFTKTVGMGKIVTYGIEEERFVIQEDKTLAEVTQFTGRSFPTASHPVLSTNQKFAVYEDSGKIIAINVTNATENVLGEGTHPFFVDEFTTGRFTEKSIVLTNLLSGAENSIAIEDPLDSSAGISVSKNRALVAWKSSVNESIVVYNVTSAGGRLITRHAGDATSFAIGNRELYLVRVKEEGTEIARFPFALDAKDELIYTVPKSLGITGLKIY